MKRRAFFWKDKIDKPLTRLIKKKKEGEGGMIWENDILTCILSCKKNIFIYIFNWSIFYFSSVQSLSHVWLFATPWTATCQASLSTINFRSLPKLISIDLAMPSNHLILCCRLLLLLSVFPSIRVFSKESVLRTKWPYLVRRIYILLY